MSEKHTPWRFGRTDMSESIMIVDSNDNYVAKILIRQSGGAVISKAMEAPRRDNAEFIVQACNSHDALLEATKWLYGQWLAYADQRYLTPDEKKRKEQAKAAIKKAEEK